MIEGKYQYFAFISYKREDEEWAKWLQHKLEHYKLPLNLNGRTDLPKEIRPVFKDTSELSPGNLPIQIQQALELSKYLIVICSPRSAKSEWVNKEVEAFISMGRTMNVIPFIIGGTPFAKDIKQECFPSALRELPQEQEILGANINEMGRDAAAVKVVARMFDIRFDELWQRHEREQKRKRFIISASVTTFILFLIGIAFWMYYQKNETQKANWKMMENQARMIAEKSKAEVNKGNTYDAILALLETIPQGDERPFVIETEEALRFAYSSLVNNRWNYRLIGSNYRKAYFSDDEKYIICLAHTSDQDDVEIYDTKSLQLVSQIISDYEKWEWPACIFPSSNSDTIYATSDKNGLLCYDIKTGKYLGEKIWTTDLLERCVNYNIDDFNKGNDQFWKEEIKRIFDLPQDATIKAFSPIEHLILYEQIEIIEERHDCRFLYVFYDYKNHRVVKRFYKQSHIKYWDEYTWEDYNNMNNASFSPNAQSIAMAYKDKVGEIISLSDYSARQFICGNQDCQHHSNRLLYGRNGKLLHSSMFEGAIKIYDSKSFEPIDSIRNNEPILSYFYNFDMTSDGNMCIVQDYTSHYIYYKTKEENRYFSYENLGPFEDKSIADTVICGRYRIESTIYGIKFSDIRKEVNSWTLIDPRISYGLYGFIHNNKYLLLFKGSYIGEFQGFDIVDLLSGKIVDQTSSVKIDHNTGNIVISKMKNRGDNNETLEVFLPLEELISACKKATSGMKLSVAARRKFFLN